MSSVSMSRISSMSTSIASVGGSNSFCSSSYSHISTASRFRMRLIWCEPYFAVRNFSRRSFTSPFSLKLTLSPVRPGDRSQSFIVSTPHCISPWLTGPPRHAVPPPSLGSCSVQNGGGLSHQVLTFYCCCCCCSYYLSLVMLKMMMPHDETIVCLKCILPQGRGLMMIGDFCSAAPK